MLRIELRGEFDLAVADRVSARLEQLIADGVRVRLNLSGLEFIDSSGIRTLVAAVQGGRQNGDQLVEISPDISPPVRSVLDLVGMGPVLWPTNSRPDNPTR